VQVASDVDARDFGGLRTPQLGTEAHVLVDPRERRQRRNDRRLGVGFARRAARVRERFEPARLLGRERLRHGAGDDTDEQRRERTAERDDAGVGREVLSERGRRERQRGTE
jgi:hypothetical protein